MTSWWNAFPGRHVAGARWPLPLLAACLLLALWLVAVRAGWVAPSLLPDPLDVARRVGEWTGTGTISRYLWPTVYAAVSGGLLAAAVGVPLGVLAAHSPALSSVLSPAVALSQAVPLVAVAPLLVLWLGYGFLPTLVLCAVVAFLPVFTTTVVGLRELDNRVLEHAVLDGAGWWQKLWQVELPMAAPAILAGVRAGFALAMTGAIVGEFVMGGAGLGTLLTMSRELADTTGVFAVLVWIAAVALVLQLVVLVAERASRRRLEGEQA